VSVAVVHDVVVVGGGWSGSSSSTGVTSSTARAATATSLAGRRIAVFASQGHVAGSSMELLDWVDEIRIVTNGRPLEVGDDELETLSDHGIGVIEDEAVELLGARGALRGVRLASGAVTSCSMAFFLLEQEPINDLAVRLRCEVDDDGYVQVNHAARTSVEGTGGGSRRCSPTRPPPPASPC
jgi:thioredoxin reductase